MHSHHRILFLLRGLETGDKDGSLRLTAVTGADIWVLFTAKLRPGICFFLYRCRSGIGHYPIGTSTTILRSKTVIGVYLKFVSELPCFFPGGLKFLCVSCVAFAALRTTVVAPGGDARSIGFIFLLHSVSLGVEVEQCLSSMN